MIKERLTGDFERDLRTVAEIVVHEVSVLLHERVDHVAEKAGEQVSLVHLEAVAQAVALAVVARQSRDLLVSLLGPAVGEAIDAAAKDVGRDLAGDLAS